MENNTLLSIAQAAEIIGLTRQACYHAIRRGLLATERVGPYRLVPVAEALRYKNNRPHPGPARKIKSQPPENTGE